MLSMVGEPSRSWFLTVRERFPVIGGLLVVGEPSRSRFLTVCGRVRVIQGLTRGGDGSSLFCALNLKHWLYEII
jgi:hypothetical protein